MSRIKRGVTAHARHKKVLKLSKGFRGRSSTCYRPALERLEKAMQYAYRDRRNRKRDFRRLWIMRINAAAREHGVKYSELVHGLTSANVQVDRKMLAELAVNNRDAFAKIVELARQ